jgi:hypothetical protein
MDERTKSLIEECKRQEESCLYTSTALFEWLKYLRAWKNFFVITPIILAAIATGIPANLRPELEWLIGGCTLIAGIATAVYKALGLDVNLDAVTKNANRFKVLQDRFRQAWRVIALEDFGEFNEEFDSRMVQMDALSSSSLPVPERFFKKAQTKTRSGDYDFCVDARKER